MPTTGEKPGPGTYECEDDCTRVTLETPEDSLPVCPTCAGTSFVKVE